MRKTLIILLIILCIVEFHLSYFQTDPITPLERNGALEICDGRIINENKEIFDLKGVSFLVFGFGERLQYLNKNSFQSLRDEWNINTIRLCFLPETADGTGGYCEEGNRAEMLEALEQSIEYASQLGMYVIVDWHFLYSENPQVFQNEANEFFRMVVRKHCDAKNILYEICNEPHGEEGNWEHVKAYADTVIRVIRTYDANSIIIVGTPQYCQDFSDPIADPIEGFNNIAYSCHFYSGTHGFSNRKSLKEALNTGLPIIVTEFGITEHNGGGIADISEANRWMLLLDEYHVGKVCFLLAKGEETETESNCSIIKSSCDKLWGWDYSDLNLQGQWLYDTYNREIPLSAAEVGVETLETETENFPWLIAAIKKEATWEENDESFSLFSVYIDRSEFDTGDMLEWKLKVEMNHLFSIHDAWSAEYEVEGNVLLISPVDWNATIRSGNGIQFGFIIKGDESFFVKSMEVFGS